MQVNIMKVPKAIAVFVVMIVTDFMVYYLLDLMIPILEDMSFITNTSEINGIVWFGAIILALLTLAIPAWILFEDSE